MGAIQQVLLGYGSAAPVAVTWDTVYRNGGKIALSGGNLIATCDASSGIWAAVLATAEFTGKQYCEMEVTTGSVNVMLGLGVRTMNFSHFCGQDADTYGYYASSGVKYNNNSSAAYGSSYTTGDVIMISVDKPAGKVWFGKNGTWQNSGDPAAGTGAAFTGLSGALYPCASNNTACVITGRFASGSFGYTPPTGFSAL